MTKITVIVFISLSFLVIVPCIVLSATLDIEIYTWDDGTADPFDTPAAAPQFPGVGEATADEPWVHSPQYLWVSYDSEALLWGIRIVTDNETNIGEVYPRPLNQGPDGQWEWVRLGNESYQRVGGAWQTGDDSVSFDGIISAATKNNPNYRALLAWQVYANPLPGAPDSIYRHPLYGWNVGSNPVERWGRWIYPNQWANIIDKSNRWYGDLSVGGIFYPGTWNQKYEMVVTGNPVVNYLAQYPPAQLSNPDPREGDPRPGDCTMAIYLAACFGIPLNDGSGNYLGILPAGNYNTTIYLELINE